MVWQASERWDEVSLHFQLKLITLEFQLSPQTKIERNEGTSFLGCSSKAKCLGRMLIQPFSLFYYGELSPELCRSILVTL